MMDDEKTMITVNRVTWEALCDISDEYEAERDEKKLYEMRYAVQKITAEGRAYSKKK